MGWGRRVGGVHLPFDGDRVGDLLHREPPGSALLCYPTGGSILPGMTAEFLQTAIAFRWDAVTSLVSSR